MNVIRKIVISGLLVFLLFGVFALDADASTDRKGGTVAVSSGWLNVRSGPSTSYTAVSSLRNGSFVTLTEDAGSWWKVEYGKGKYGYCRKDYISVISASPSTVSTSSGSLNVRSGPGTSYTRTGSLNKGEAVLILSSSNGWSRVLFHGTKTGYVSTKYLSSGYSAVSLWVRNMKQMDDRWGDTMVGTSGQTMAKIGCATTAIAMLESHRTGIIRYPDEMMTLLKYTPSGSVYWPSHYTTVTNPSGYLMAIYNLLRQGKPILFGATNRYGSQHWVIITGFTGGAGITADKFTINDPGSWSRTNLQQFLDIYPNFYKYFYY